MWARSHALTRMRNAARGLKNEYEEYLAGIFSRDGFSDGYFTGKIGEKMFGVRGLTTNSFPLKNAEYKRATISFTLSKKTDKELTLSARTSDGYGAESSVLWEKATKAPTSKKI